MANNILTDNQSMKLQLQVISTIKIRAALTCWSKNVQDGAPHNVICPRAEPKVEYFGKFLRH